MNNTPESLDLVKNMKTGIRTPMDPETVLVPLHSVYAIDHDQPALYISEPQVDEDAIEAEYEPIVSYGVPRQLKQSISNAMLPVAVAALFLSLRLTGDASTALSLSVSLPALGLALIGAITPWVER